MNSLRQNKNRNSLVQNQVHDFQFFFLNLTERVFFHSFNNVFF